MDILSPVQPSVPSHSSFRTWLQLLRAPNLFTVPGDPLAGFLLVNQDFLDWTLLAACFAAVCFYAAGLLLNDLADEAEDRRDRPARPLPSGAASRGRVLMAALALNASGLGALAASGHPRALAVGAALVFAVALYNFVTKRWPVIGALNMGLCRGLSVMLGATVGPYAAISWMMALFAAAIFGLYIAAVTNLARHETKPRAPILARLLPAALLILACAGVIPVVLGDPARAPAAALWALAGGAALWLAVRMFQRSAPPLPPLIGAHIRVLLPLQAAACWSGEPWSVGRWAAGALLLCWPLSRAVSRRFYAS